MNSLIFVGYNLYDTDLDDKVLVSGEIKNANYLYHELRKIQTNIIPISINLDINSADNCRHTIKKSSHKGVFRWFFEGLAINKVIETIRKDNKIDYIYLTIPSYLPFLKINNFEKVIITAHGTYWPELLADLKYEKNYLKKIAHLVNGALQLLIDKISFSRAKLVHSVSEFQVQEMKNTYKLSDDKIKVVRNGTNYTNFNNETRTYDLLWVGRLAKKKNIGLLKDLINKINNENLNIAVCQGNDYFSIDIKSKIIIDDLSNRKKVTPLTALNESHLERLYNNSKVLIVTSTGYESIPTVIFEALASGCKVVAPKSWGVMEVEGQGLYLYEEGSLDSLLNCYTLATQDHVSPSIEQSVTWQSRALQFKEILLK